MRPTCGSGSLLIKVGRQADVRDFALFGLESNGTTHALCRMNMFLHGMDSFRIEWGDTLRNPRLVLVTDRIDLDEQIWKTFHQWGKEPEQAKTGRHLIELIEDDRVSVITTVLDKFGAAAKANDSFRNLNADLFVLVDESHRSQYGEANLRMMKALPNACFIGFTGTPLMKREKNTAQKFGGIIEPPYTIRDAVADKAVVPLLYEGRHVSQDVNQKAVDRMFEELCEGLLTGFDAPRNVVLYIARSLKEHTLLQAIARVNRLYLGKDYGYIIDYHGVIGELHDALELYGKLAGQLFDPEDLEAALTDVREELKQLPSAHDGVWDMFRDVPNKQDDEAYVLALEEPLKREEFYTRVSRFSRLLKIGLSTLTWLNSADSAKVERYKRDVPSLDALRMVRGFPQRPGIALQGLTRSGRGRGTDRRRRARVARPPRFLKGGYGQSARSQSARRCGVRSPAILQHALGIRNRIP